MHPLILTDLEIRERVWMELGRAVNDRHHEWRTPVLATVEKDGSPNARTVVLRHADSRQQNLQFYTDSRSPKIAELMCQPAATLVFWSKRLNWQLRIKVEIAVQITGPYVDEAWSRLGQTAAAGDYLSIKAPGDALSSAPVEKRNITGVHHLAILSAQVQAIDWLELRRDGHRRANFAANWWEWLVP